ncbi:MAG: Veg family protein [Tepidanaerobacteraceae bacterium]|nr:Veg family protein [Tepidanaerobacteraceae bacterium]
MASADALRKIRKDVELNVGKMVKLRANRGRKKTFEKEGVLEQVYPNIFVVKVIESADFVRRISYSYSDILTDTVELTVLQNEEPKLNYGSM